MSGNKDMKQLLKELSAQDFDVQPRPGKSSRLRVQAPDGAVTFLSKSSGDYRSHPNALNWAKSHGFEPNGKKEKHMGRSTEGQTAAAAARSVASRSVFASRRDTVHLPPKPSEETRDVRRAPVPSPFARVEPVEEPEPAPELVEDSEPAAVAEPVLVDEGTAFQGYAGLPKGHPAWPDSQPIPLGDGVWLEAVRVVTPALAELWLTWNTHNRNAAQRVVGGYSRDMETGGFYDKQGDPIRFSDTGVLLDGQQRLKSLVEAGSSAQFVVITGLPMSSQDTMDIGRKRTVADQLRLNKFSSPEVVGAAARVLWALERNSLISRIPSPSSPEVLEKVVSCSEGKISLEDAARLVAPARKVVRMQGVATALAWLMAEKSLEDATRFWEMLATGEIDAEDRAVLALRETLMRRMLNKQLRSQPELAYLVIKAWNAWRSGSKQKTYMMPPRLKQEDFPRLV